MPAEVVGLSSALEAPVQVGVMEVGVVREGVLLGHVHVGLLLHQLFTVHLGAARGGR